jgi:hypothetical protein
MWIGLSKLNKSKDTSTNLRSPARDSGCLFGILGRFWPPEAEAAAKRLASGPASGGRASHGSRPCTGNQKPPDPRVRWKPAIREGLHPPPEPSVLWKPQLSPSTAACSSAASVRRPRPHSRLPFRGIRSAGTHSSIPLRMRSSPAASSLGF